MRYTVSGAGLPSSVQQAGNRGRHRAASQQATVSLSSALLSTARGLQLGGLCPTRLRSSHSDAQPLREPPGSGAIDQGCGKGRQTCRRVDGQAGGAGLQEWGTLRAGSSQQCSSGTPHTRHRFRSVRRRLHEQNLHYLTERGAGCLCPLTVSDTLGLLAVLLAHAGWIACAGGEGSRAGGRTRLRVRLAGGWCRARTRRPATAGRCAPDDGKNPKSVCVKAMLANNDRASLLAHQHISRAQPCTRTQAHPLAARWRQCAGTRRRPAAPAAPAAAAGTARGRPTGAPAGAAPPVGSGEAACLACWGPLILSTTAGARKRSSAWPKWEGGAGCAPSPDPCCVCWAFGQELCLLCSNYSAHLRVVNGHQGAPGRRLEGVPNADPLLPRNQRVHSVLCHCLHVDAGDRGLELERRRQRCGCATAAAACCTVLPSEQGAACRHARFRGKLVRRYGGCRCRCMVQRRCRQNRGQHVSLQPSRPPYLQHAPCLQVGRRAAEAPGGSLRLVPAAAHARPAAAWVRRQPGLC